MEQLAGGTAVVTGAASGIGAALARCWAEAGMNVVLADIEPDPLEAMAEELLAEGARVLAVPTDVSSAGSVDALAKAAEAEFGPVHLLCNNAGVGGGGLIATLSEADWDWVLGVNLWGVIHGLRAFLPGMLAHGQPAHVVNTASVAGLITTPFMGPYNASKFAVVAISETLYHEMRMTGTAVGVSVLCPGWVRTRIHESSRNRPGGSVAPVGEGLLSSVIASGLDPAQVAGAVRAAVVADHFYVLTHPEMTPAVEARMEAIVSGRNPELRAGGLFGSVQPASASD
ncbi:MAG: SDR family NAD(P)-dependent oxidoreductase [Acidimicrobiales bacterium]